MRVCAPNKAIDAIATIWLLVAFPGDPGRARERASRAGIHGQEPMNMVPSGVY